MTLPVWPVTLPSIPILNGSGIDALHDDPIETEMEDGEPRARRRSTTTWARISLRFKMTNAQFLVFQAFVRDTLEHRSSRFTMPVWKPGATLPLPQKTVRLADKPAIEAMGNINFVTLPLGVLEY